MNTDVSQQHEPQEPEVEVQVGLDDVFTHEQLNSALRAIGKETSFLIPHLRPGMDLLDCGCGTGAITVGLAELLNPGSVIGVDVSELQIERARTKALESTADNVEFYTANVYSLPFDDNTSDAAFIHTVLQHLIEPSVAISEIIRVLKPGGVIGVRDSDWAGHIRGPSNQLLDAAWELYTRFHAHKGRHPYAGRNLRAFLREGGFLNVKGSASSEHSGDTESVQATAQVMSMLFNSPDFVEPALDLGWIDRPGIDEIVAAWKEWGEHPDAYYAFTNCEAVGWKP
jgi:SAM-dependent methyltransferase